MSPRSRSCLAGPRGVWRRNDSEPLIMIGNSWNRGLEAAAAGRRRRPPARALDGAAPAAGEVNSVYGLEEWLSGSIVPLVAAPVLAPTLKIKIATAPRMMPAHWRPVMCSLK